MAPLCKCGHLPHRDSEPCGGWRDGPFCECAEYRPDTSKSLLDALQPARSYAQKSEVL
jgi:hypothetical protein